MEPAVKSTLENVLDFWPVISAIGLFILTYIKLMGKVDGLLKSMNGIGSKLKSLDDKVDESEVENILRMSEIQQRISRIEGLLEGIFKPMQKNGEA